MATSVFNVVSFRCPWDIQLEMLSIVLRGQVGTEDVYLEVSSLHYLLNIQSRILRILRWTYFHRPKRSKSPLNSFTKELFWSANLVCLLFIGQEVSGGSIFLNSKSPPFKCLCGSIVKSRMFLQGWFVCRKLNNLSPWYPESYSPPLSWPKTPGVQHTTSQNS